MSTTVNIIHRSDTKVVTAADENRGTLAIWLVIATEAALFVGLFSSYFLIGNNKDRWAVNRPPKLSYSLIELGIMIGSAVIILCGETLVARGRYAVARLAMAISFLFGLAFLAVQSFDFFDHWKTLSPDSDSYGSIFYTITITHDAHVIAGMLILLYVLFLPRIGPSRITPYRPYHVAALYWYFVTVVLFFVVVILTVIPNGIVYGY